MKPMCVICTDVFTNDSTISVIHCGHPFHEHCLSNWLRDGQNNTCPQCRYIATPQTVIKKLYFTESGDGNKNDEDNLINNSMFNEVNNHNNKLMSEIEFLKQSLKDNEEDLEKQTILLEKKDRKNIELENAYKSALHELNELKSLLASINKKKVEETENSKLQQKLIVLSKTTKRKSALKCKILKS